LGDLSADAKTTTKYMIRRNSFRVNGEFLCGREKGSVVGSCKYCHEHTGSIEAGNFMAA
jgi:hypothetical protein